MVRDDAAGTPTRLIISNGGTAQSGTSARLSFYEGTSEKGYIERRRDGSGKIAFVTPADDNPFVWENPTGEIMRINNSNVGIGTTSPQSKLHIETGSGGTYNPNANHDDVTIEGSGNIGLQLFSPNTSYQYIAFGDPDSVNSGYLRYHHTTNEMVLRTNGSDQLRINSSGNVGIGGNAPSYLLDVRDGTASGAIARFSAINPHVIIESSTAGNAVLHFKPNTTGAKNGQFKVTAGNGYGFSWSNDAAGTGETAYMDLDTSTTGGGDLTVKGDVIAYGAPSDRKYKENIKPIESALDKAMQLQGVTFDWKDSDSILDIKEDIGFIAQDVQEVLPELVRDSGKGNLSLRYQGITPILLEAIKELKAEIDLLKSKPCTCNKCNCNI